MQARNNEVTIKHSMVLQGANVPTEGVSRRPTGKKVLIESKEISLKSSNTKRLWAQEETNALVKCYPTDTAITVIAERIGRTPQAVTNKAKRLGLRRPLTLKRQRAAEARKNQLIAPNLDQGLASATLEIGRAHG